MHKTSNTFSKLLSILNNNPFFRALIFTAGLFLISVMGLYALFFVGQASKTDLDILLEAFISFIPYFYAICAFLFLLPLIGNFLKRNVTKHSIKKTFPIILITSFLIFLFLFGPYRFILFASDNRIFTNCEGVIASNGCYPDTPCYPIEQYFDCAEGHLSFSDTGYHLLYVGNEFFDRVGPFLYLKEGFYSKKEFRKDNSVYYRIHKR